MTVRRTTLAGTTYEFASLSDLLAKATPARSGDVLAGCAAESQAQRVAAQVVLADVPLQVFLDEHVVAPEIADLGLETYSRYREGDSVYVNASGELTRFTGEIFPVPPATEQAMVAHRNTIGLRPIGRLKPAVTLASTSAPLPRTPSNDGRT